MESSMFSVAGLAARTVHVHMRPTARTFFERHEVLKVLERFGEVTMFRSLKYHPINPHPDTFLAIFFEARSVESLLQISPLRYRLTVENTEQPEASKAHTQESNSNGRSETETPIPDSPDENSKVFELAINSSDFSHYRHLHDPKLNPLHENFVPEIRSAFSNSLRRILPDAIWTEGLMDWETDSMRRKKWVEEEVAEDGRLKQIYVGVNDDHERRLLRALPTPRSGKSEIPWRMLRKSTVNREKWNEEKLPMVMKGLRQLHEERGIEKGKLARGRDT